MRKAFIKYILFIFLMEMILHIACFHTFPFSSILFLFFSSVVGGGFLTILSSIIQNEKIRKIVVRILLGIIVFFFGAELVYFSIYESFFSFNGVQFAGAIVGGYDKVLSTIFHNILSILFFLVPAIWLMIKVPTIQRNRFDFIVILLFMIVCSSYSLVFTQVIGKKDVNSLYSLVHYQNLPVKNVEKMGLLSSTSLSLQRRLLGYTPDLKQEEDVLNNKRSILMDKVDTKYNIDYTIDFRRLMMEEDREEIRNLHQYYYRQEATEQNEFTGLFQEKNLIFIMAESFDEIAIDPELTPTLYKLKNEGIIFNNYFSPKYPASTADGEYMLEWGTLPIIGENYSLIDMVYNENPYLLPIEFKKYGYKTYVYHDYMGYYNRRDEYFRTLNFDGHKYCNEGITTQCEFFHGSDLDMMEQTADDFISQDRFFAYYITLSGHGSYDSSNFVAEKHLSKVSHLSDTYQMKYYLAANIDFDLAMNVLITKLEEANKLDDTVIVISSDHAPYYLSNQEVNTRSSIDRDNKFDRNRGSLIIYNSAYTKKTVIDKYAMNIDVLPTVLNLFEMPYDSRLIIGKDIMAPNNEGVVIFPDRSWINNKGSYDTSNGKFIPFTDDVDEKYIQRITNEVNEKYSVSVSTQYNDYLKTIFQ